VPLAAHADPRIVAHSRLMPGLQLIEDQGEWTLSRDGEESALALPAGIRVEALIPLGKEWMLAGSRDNAGGERDLIFLRGGEDGPQTVRTPRRELGSTALLPSLVTAPDGTLIGATWLEGNPPGHYAVRWSSWKNGRFASPQTVSPAGPGSQTGLTGARLADGRVLLVWAGFDGQDDEIMASVSGPRGWSRPVRVAPDNQVPDITPAVTATPQGALVVWSRYDGSEYRLAAARFDGHAFLDARFVGPAGSLYPSFEGDANAPTLLYRDARRSDWAAAQISSLGDLGRTSRLEGGAAERPVIAPDSSGVLWRVGRRSVATGWQ